MSTINGNFAGPGVSDPISAAKGAVVQGTVAGFWPSYSARFVMEISSDGGTTWTEMPSTECGVAGADYPGDNYTYTAALNPAVVGTATYKLPAASQVRLRCNGFRSGSAAWTLSTS